jgi:hypothetical protein
MAQIDRVLTSGKITARPITGLIGLVTGILISFKSARQTKSHNQIKNVGTRDFLFVKRVPQSKLDRIAIS